MRPLRCSMRPGFQGRSKWKRSAQCAWKFRPSRAASVASRMRSGSFRIGVEAALDLLAPCAAREAVDDLDALVGAVGALDRLLEDRLQVALRALAVLGEDQDAAVVPLRRRALSARLPKGGRSGQRFSRIQSMSRRVLASGRWRVFSAISCIWSSSACSRRQSASAAASRGDSASAAAVTASICGVLLGLELLGRPLAALVVGVGRGGEELEPASSLSSPARRRPPAPSPTAARPSRGGPSGCARRPRSTRAGAAAGRRRAAPRRPALGARCSRSAPRAPCGTRRAGATARARARRRAGRR